MYILGINGGVRLGYQDVSAVLLKDGHVLGGYEEERLNRVKNSPAQLPELSIRKLLSDFNINIKDIDVVATHGSTWGSFWPELLKRYFKNSFGFTPSLTVVHHHDAHAASAYYASGFDKAMILTADGSGDGVSTQLSVGSEDGMELFQRYSRPDSLGIFYSLITQFCGFTKDCDEYKVMGLAPYGDASAVDLSWLLDVSKDGYKLNDDFLIKFAAGQAPPTRQEMLFNENLRQKLGKNRLYNDPLSEYYKNVAASAQHQLEQALISLVTKLHEQTGLRKLCLAGGVALNCKANQKLMQLPFIDEIFVQPASSDAGISLGAAYLASAENGIQPQPIKNVFWGKSYSDEVIEKVLKNTGSRYKKTDDPAAVAAEKIAADKVVAWFQGRMEFGPRALGARSILANPKNAEMKDILNHKIKFREGFRPFCPSVLEEDAGEYFDGAETAAPYMTLTFDAKADASEEIPAVVHFDGTARIQTVNEDQHPLYYGLLRNLKEENGAGVVVNTSFNTNNEPVVESPLDAVAIFHRSGIDYMVIGNYLVEK